MATVTLRVKNWPSNLNRYTLYYVVALFSGGWVYDTYNVKQGYIGLPPTMGPFVLDYDKMKETYDRNLIGPYGEFATSVFMLEMASPISGYALSPSFIPQPDQTYVWDLATNTLVLVPTLAVVTVTNRSTKLEQPSPALLFTEISVMIGETEIGSLSEQHNFAANESYSIPFAFTIHTWDWYKSGSVLVAVLDPTGKQIASGAKTFST